MPRTQWAEQLIVMRFQEQVQMDIVHVYLKHRKILVQSLSKIQYILKMILVE